MNQEILEHFFFHDNYIHGISFVDENFSCDLVLDIDHIQEWFCEQEPCEFLVAPATLTFKEVNSLAVTITKPTFSMNSYLGVILEVASVELTGSRRAYEIKMVGENHIRFEAEGVKLQVKGAAVKTTEQYLSTKQRHMPNKTAAADVRSAHAAEP